MQPNNSEDKDVKDLMKPRYKVIAPYPYCPYEIGDLVEISDLGTNFHCTTTREWNVFTEENESQVNYFSIDILDTWSHLFKKLEWWEERSIEEMPMYVKALRDTMKFNEGEVLKVLNWYDYPQACIFHNNYHAQVLTPSTESEYNEYLKSKP